MVGRLAGMVVFLGAAAMGARAASVPSSALTDYAVLGLEEVTLGHGVRVASGDVGANGGDVVLDARVRVAGTVAGTRVRIGKRVKLGDLFCFLVQGPRRFTCEGFSLPFIEAASLPPVQAQPGTTPTMIPAHTRTAPLSAGSYGEARVGERAILNLAGGTYVFESIQLDRHSQLTCQADCRIEVAGRVRLAPHASATGLGNIRFEIAHEGRQAAFRAARDVLVQAVVYAPAGTIDLGPHGHFTGSVVGRSVVVGRRTRLALGGS